MARFLLLLFLFLSAAFSPAQSSFRKLSRPEKCWVLSHPFKAKKAQKITREVLRVVDSVKQSGVIGVDMNGGKLDAFRHAYWMGSLAYSIGATDARKLGQAHEKGNYRQFKKHSLEDMILPDSVSCLMDLANNNLGIVMTEQCRCSHGALRVGLLQSVAQDKLFTIRKDEKGNYLMCDGTPLNLSEWRGKWDIPKCLVAPLSR